ncbi:MAG: hypothetical protein JXA61_05405 [Bacteroidales bacterium]|nr:hypothetical protein [Bacteroidales bacterium]
MKARLLFLLILLTCGFTGQTSDPPSDAQVMQEWKAFYKTHFNLDISMSEVDIPPFREEYVRIIIVAEGITCEDIILEMKQEFEVLLVNKYLPNYFDRQVKSRRNNDRTYAIRVKNNEVAGENQATTGVETTSPGTFEIPDINNITLLERLIYELKYYDETRNHLDIETFTVCSGSHFDRDSLELSPAVGWRTGRGDYYPPFLFISECFSAFTLDGMYSRNVISF